MKKKFFKTAIKSIKTTGAIAESSKYLVKSMLKNIDFSTDLQILELGAGHGNITKTILKKMSAGSQLHSFEINEVFYKEMTTHIIDDRLELYLASAEHLEEQLKLKSIDVVVSALPLAIFSKKLKKDIFISMKKVMKKNAIFVQYQYSLNDYKLIKKEFDAVNLKMNFLNIPPAFIYVGTSD